MSEYSDVLRFLAIICVPIVVVAIAVPVGRAIAERVRKPFPGAHPDIFEQLSALDARLGRLESSIDAIAIEVERNGELQRHAARLLEGQARAVAPDPSAPRIGTVTPH